MNFHFGLWIILLIITFAHKVISSQTWTPLLSTSKKVIVLPEANFDEAEERCSKLHGHLIDFGDGYEVARVANEIERLFPHASSDLWIGIRKKGFFYKWTTGRYFNMAHFNLSKDEHPSDDPYRNNLCGALFTGRFMRDTSYQILMLDCWLTKKSLCQAAIDPYEAISITSIVLSGLSILALVAIVIWWMYFRSRRNYVNPLSYESNTSTETKTVA